MQELTPLRSSLPDGWKLLPLGGMCSKIGSGATPRGGSAAYIKIGTAFIRSQNVLDHSFAKKGLVFIDATDAEKLSNVAVNPRDVLLNITGDGDTIARCCVVPDDVLPARVNQHVVIIRPGGGLISEYLQRYLSHPVIREYMLSHNSGGSRRALTKGQIEQFEIVIPPIDVQVSIAQNLGALDDKIAVNESIMSTADSLMAAYFSIVRADTAREVKLGGLVDLRYGKALKEEDRAPGSVPVFGGNGVSGWHDTPLNQGPGIIVGRKGANAGSVSWSPGPFWAIDTSFYVEPASNSLPLEFLFFLLQSAGFRGLVGDSAIPGLNREIALGAAVKLPAATVISRFTEIARPLLAMSAQLAEESRSLARLRDTLLPKLMSGEIRVREAEKIVEDVTL